MTDQTDEPTEPTTVADLPDGLVVIGDPAHPDPTYGIVVGHLDGDEGRDALALVVALGPARTYPADQITAADELED